MDMPASIRTVVKKLMRVRIPSTRAHALLAWEYRLRQMALSELARVLYFQPMFESLCKSVGPGCRLDICPDSKLPVIVNVELELGARVQLSARSTFSGGRNANGRPQIRIGDDSYLGTRCVLRAGTGITIGRHVRIASNALISCDPGHPLDSQRRRSEPAPAEDLGQIIIGDDVWFGYNVSVLGSVRIGDGAVIGSSTVVVSDIPPYALAVGNPAKVIRFLDGRSAPGGNRMSESAKGELFMDAGPAAQPSETT